MPWAAHLRLGHRLQLSSSWQQRTVLSVGGAQRAAQCAVASVGLYRGRRRRDRTAAVACSLAIPSPTGTGFRKLLGNYKEITAVSLKHSKNTGHCSNINQKITSNITYPCRNLCTNRVYSRYSSQLHGSALRSAAPWSAAPQWPSLLAPVAGPPTALTTPQAGCIHGHACLSPACSFSCSLRAPRLPRPRPRPPSRSSGRRRRPQRWRRRTFKFPCPPPAPSHWPAPGPRFEPYSLRLGSIASVLE